MTCQLESNGHRRVFWEFSCNGQSYLRFESKDRSWRELKPGCKSLKETLDSARDLLLRISAGDCVNRLKEAEALDTKGNCAEGKTCRPLEMALTLCVCVLCVV